MLQIGLFFGKGKKNLKLDRMGSCGISLISKMWGVWLRRNFGKVGTAWDMHIVSMQRVAHPNKQWRGEKLNEY